MSSNEITIISEALAVIESQLADVGVELRPLKFEFGHERIYIKFVEKESSENVWWVVVGEDSKDLDIHEATKGELANLRLWLRKDFIEH